MTFGELSLVVNESMLALLKILILFGLLLYLSFSILIVRQVQLMTKTVTGELDRTVRMLSWGHFLISAMVFILALVIL